MSEHYYPALATEKDFVLAARLARSNPTYLTDPACPYGQPLKDVLVAPKAGDNNSDDTSEPINLDGVQERIKRLINELDAYGKEDGRSSADKNTYFRLSVTLVKELMDMQKEVSLMIEHEAFVNEILAILDEVCDVDQRTMVTERMKKFVGEKNVEVSE